VLTDMLEAVVTRGTGKAAAVLGYRLAGKSGTAQKTVGDTYSADDFIASFGGFGPLPTPRVACLVVIDSPGGDIHAGGSLAGPPFASIMTAALRHLRVPPDHDTLPEFEPEAPEEFALFEQGPPATRPAVVPGRMPDAAGLGLRAAIVELAAAGCTVRATGQGHVVDQRPAPGEPIEAGSSCSLVLGELAAPAPDAEPAS
jgi:membrane peptidoglycan carboxypeptidase